MAKQEKRERFEVVFSKKQNAWCARHVGMVRDVGGTFSFKSAFGKRRAIDEAVGQARRRAPSQLFIKGKNGKIQDERTYGADPRRTRG